MRIHIFVDAENIHIGVFEKGFSYLRHRYDIINIDVVGKETILDAHYGKYKDNSMFNLINCFYGKNSADTFLTAYIINALHNEPLTDCFVVFTQDRDLTIAIKFITDFAKQVILVTEANRELHNLQALDVDMSLVTQLNFEISRVKHQKRMLYFPIPDVQKKNFAYVPKTIFLKTGENYLIKVHFYNGIRYNLFLNIIPVKKIRQGYSSKMRFRDILSYSYLYVKNDRVYIDLDSIMGSEIL